MKTDATLLVKNAQKLLDVTCCVRSAYPVACCCVYITWASHSLMHDINRRVKRYIWLFQSVISSHVREESVWNPGSRTLQSSLVIRGNGRNTYCCPTTPIIVRCYTLRSFAHPAACRCVLLGVVTQSLKPIKLLRQQHLTFLLFGDLWSGAQQLECHPFARRHTQISITTNTCLSNTIKIFVI